MIRYLKEGWILIDTATETMFGNKIYQSRSEMLKTYDILKSTKLFSDKSTIKPLRKKQRITVEDIKRLRK